MLNCIFNATDYKFLRNNEGLDGNLAPPRVCRLMPESFSLEDSFIPGVGKLASYAEIRVSPTDATTREMRTNAVWRRRTRFVTSLEKKSNEKVLRPTVDDAFPAYGRATQNKRQKRLIFLCIPTTYQNASNVH